MPTIGDIQSMLDRKKGERDQIVRDFDLSSRRVKKLTMDVEASEKARSILQLVARETQEQLEYRVSELVSLALSSVFEEPYKLKLQFVVRRGKTECDILFERDGKGIDPLFSSGGGAVDVAAFALRVALWNLSRPRTRNVLILDEPFRFLSRDLQRRASMMLKRLSAGLGLQIIMSSHSPDLIDGADQVFETAIEKGVTIVEPV